jgi:hypothetical protein
MSTDGLRPTFYIINAVVYLVQVSDSLNQIILQQLFILFLKLNYLFFCQNLFQIALWLFLWWMPIQPVFVLCKLFISGDVFEL